VCSRHVSLPEVIDRPQLAIVKPTVPSSPTCDDDVEPLEADSHANSLTHSAEQDMLHVADLSTDRMPVAVTYDDSEFVEYEEEVQER